MNVLKYKEFIGSIEVDTENLCLHGKLLYINDLITYEAKTIRDLQVEFQKATEEYITSCEKLGRRLHKPFKGSFNVRIGPELHKNAMVHAAQDGITLNEFIKIAIQNQIKYEQNLQGRA